MKTLNLINKQVSGVVFVSPGSRITSSGNGYIEYTPGTETDARNAPKWKTWAKGSDAGYMDTVHPMCIRATATGAMTVTVGEDEADKYGAGAYFEEDAAYFTKDSSGNVIGFSGPSVSIPLNGELTTPITVLYEGDSITARGAQQPSFPSLPGGANVYSGYGNLGYPTWERAALGTAYDIVNTAVSGETIEQITARMLATDFSPYAAVSLMCGMNNVIGSTTADVTADMAMIEDVVKRCKTYGKPLRIFTITPREATDWTANERAYVLAMNTAIRKLPKTYPHVFVGDAFWTMQTQASADPDPDAGMLPVGDTTHPSKLGSFRIAKYAGVDSMRSALQYAGYTRVLSSGRPVQETYTELLTNTDFKTQTGGTNSAGAILTAGAVPSGWRLINTSCTDIKIFYPFYVPDAKRQRGMWATGAIYDVDDTVTEAGAAYLCTTAHTAAAAFADDAAKWKRVWVTDYCWQVTFTGDAANDGVTLQRAAQVSGTPADVVRGVFGLATEGEVSKMLSVRGYLEHWSDATPGPSRGHFNEAMFPAAGVAEVALNERIEGLFFTSKQAPFSVYTGALAINQFVVIATLKASGTASVILHSPSMRKY